MSTVQRASELLEEIFFDEFKGAYLDKEEYPSLILDIHKYFKYQTRIYTFNTEKRVKQLYDDLRAGRISESALGHDGKLASYPLLFLTYVSQKLMARMYHEERALQEDTYNSKICRKAMISELAELMTMHGYEQEIINDDYYQSAISAEKWETILNDNPWLIIAVLLHYTGYTLTENLYAYIIVGSELLEGIGK